MLVMSRKSGDTIEIGDAKVMFLEIKSGRIRIGVQAPRSIPVFRGETADTIREQESLRRPIPQWEQVRIMHKGRAVRMDF